MAWHKAYAKNTNNGEINDTQFIGEIVEVPNAESLKKLGLLLKSELNNAVIVLVANISDKASVAILLDEEIANTHNWEAPKIIKEKVAPLIKGGGGGQKYVATAGGQDISQLQAVIDVVKGML